MPTTSDYLTQLEQDREDLIDNLETKGITGLSGDETFTELVPEVLNIPSGGSSHDWSAIGYSAEPPSISNGYNHAKYIYDNWDNTETNLYTKFYADNELIYMPLVDTSNVTTMSNTFNGCKRLRDVPLFNTSSLTGSNCFSNTFSNCFELTDQSLDNILQMCINATNYTSTTGKKLTKLGISDTTAYPASRIQALTHYQDFIDAGWTIGY